jgi:hypothetical protein
VYTNHFSAAQFPAMALASLDQGRCFPARVDPCPTAQRSQHADVHQRAVAELQARARIACEADFGYVFLGCRGEYVGFLNEMGLGVRFVGGGGGWLGV